MEYVNSICSTCKSECTCLDSSNNVAECHGYRNIGQKGWVIDIVNNKVIPSEEFESEIRADERKKILSCLPKCHNTEFKCLLSRDDCFECMNQSLDKITEKVKEQKDG